MHMHTEPSLTLDTLSSVLDGIQRLDGINGVSYFLQIPDSKRDELERQYDRRQRPRAYSTVFLTDNPSPSWSGVAYALWQAGEHGALEVVQKLYLKGEPCAHSCRSEGNIASLLGTCTLFHPSDTVWLLIISLEVVLVSNNFMLCMLIHCCILCNCVHTSSLVALVQ